jgi:hypothetical protein
VTTDDLLPRFLTFSREVTGFSTLDLQGTGQAPSYLDTVLRVVGEATLEDLLEVYRRTAALAPDDREERTRLLSRDLFSDEKLGPVARSIIKLWYVGVWFELPPAWAETFGVLENDGTFTASPQAYPEGLLWRAIGANPPGARAPGYGSWAEPPRIPAIAP